jgi:hypothetical protein
LFCGRDLVLIDIFLNKVILEINETTSNDIIFAQFNQDFTSIIALS